ncbi:DNA-binding anti-repressor SinI [Bacillus sp. CGMCC 1.16607]
MSRRMDWLKDLDKEWVQLIMEAKQLGMDLSTIREFLHGNEIKELLIEK